MNQRNRKGSFIAENAAVMVFLFLGLLFPLMNLATSTYRYNMVCGAAKQAAHQGASAPTFSDTTKGAAGVIPATISNYLGTAKGITNVSSKFRINQADINTQAVTRQPWGQKLNAPADPDTYVYTIEVVIDADVSPLMTMPPNGFIPTVPGLTSTSHQTVSAQEVAESIQGLDQ